ncbi:phosphotransferase enzyme family protein [Paenibacillus sp. HW567]|uniref:phosphotransferase enzyme family protein n=1 Tax=Paenibacillus sp. HW567 TaxID=1034769 RepID=UPI00037087A3|nr:phosphotransferase [Paenibacillus sp. HW567]
MMVEKSVILQMIELLGCREPQVHLIGGYYQNVYEIAAEEPMVVKFFNRTFNEDQQVLSEIEWIEHLHNNNVNTVVPIKINNNDSYINRLAGEHFCVVYRKAQGEHVDINDEQVWNSKLFARWGRGMASMHALSQSFTGSSVFPDWTEQKLFTLNTDHLDSRINEKWTLYNTELRDMHTSPANYGIIHGDLHHHNFLVQNGELTFIDFGDSEYHWFAYDIAIAIYHAAQTVKDAVKRKEFAKRFFNAFMEGYEVNHPVKEVRTQVDYFINYRHLYSYVYHMQFSDKDNLDEKQLNYLQDMGQSIINQDSYLGIALV